MYLKRREFFVGLENRVFQHNRPTPAIDHSKIRGSGSDLRFQPVNATPALRLWLWRIAGVGQVDVQCWTMKKGGESFLRLIKINQLNQFISIERLPRSSFVRAVPTQLL